MSTISYSDEWVWGREQILWGFNSSHRYTLKVLEPKLGRAGCLSLQYHHEKSESWVVIRGVAWALIAVGDTVCTRLLRPGSVQSLPTGTLHRITAVELGTQILESSTPDRHAADKSVPKDVVRLHCFHGRPVESPRNEREARLVRECIQLTESALTAIAAGAVPDEKQPEIACALGPARIES